MPEQQTDWEEVFNTDDIIINSVPDGIEIEYQNHYDECNYAKITPLALAQEFLHEFKERLSEMHELRVMVLFDLDNDMFQYLDINQCQKPESLYDIRLPTLSIINSDFLDGLSYLCLNELNIYDLDKLPNSLRVLRISSDTEITTQSIIERCPNIKTIVVNKICLLNIIEN